MMAGRPPFHASNHVELARVIERTNDRIVFPDEKPDHARTGSDDEMVSNEPIDPILKDLVRQLLKMNPADRMLFDQFFAHPALQPQSESYEREREVGGDKQKRANVSSALSSDTYAQPQSIRERAASGSSSHTRSSSMSNDDSMRKDAIYNHHRHYLRQAAYPPTTTNTRHDADDAQYRMSAANANQRGSADVLYAMEDMHIGRDDTLQQYPATHYYSNEMGPSFRPKHSAYNNGRMAANPPEEQYRNWDNGLTNALTVVTSPPPAAAATAGAAAGAATSNHQRQSSSTVEEEQALAEREYVVIEKRAVEMNVLADELESSPRTPIVFYPPRAGAIQQAPGVARQMSALARAVREAVSSQYNISAEAANGPLTSKLASEAANATDSSFAHRGSTSKRAAAAAASSLSNSNGVFNPLDAGLAETFESRFMQGTSQEDPTIRRMEGLAYKALAMSYLADLKWRLLPSSITGRSGGSNKNSGSARIRDTLADPESGFLNSSDISIEEAFALYLRALALLHYATIEASRYWRSVHGPPAGSGTTNKNSKQGGASIGSSTEPGSGSVTVSAAFNNAVQWVRNKFNECLERAEMLKQLANGNELDNVAQVPVVQVLYEQALALSKAAAIRELKWIDPLDCDRAYQLAIWMLSAILETADANAKQAQQHYLQTSFQSDEEPPQQYDEMELEDRTIVEQFIASIVKRRETLQRRLMQQHRQQQEPNNM
ncbi:Serine/threonine-protein kinase [Coemansia erecta]|nr:Serine/threonine-protein kinase [Coemansia erecta]